jgi:uncharacterized protein
VTVEEKPAVVFDCMVFLQAAISHQGPSHAAYRLFEEGVFRLYVSSEVLAEVSDVLTRPKVTRKFPSLTADKVADLLGQLHREAVLIPDVPQVFVYERDPKDERYLNLAITASAHYLVTWDRDLLDLMSESSSEGQTFRQSFPQLTILNPPGFLRELTSEPAPTVD